MTLSEELMQALDEDEADGLVPSHWEMSQEFYDKLCEELDPALSSSASHVLGIPIKVGARKAGFVLRPAQI